MTECHSQLGLLTTSSQHDSIIINLTTAALHSRACQTYHTPTLSTATHTALYINLITASNFADSDVPHPHCLLLPKSTVLVVANFLSFMLTVRLEFNYYGHAWTEITVVTKNVTSGKTPPPNQKDQTTKVC